MHNPPGVTITEPQAVPDYPPAPPEWTLYVTIAIDRPQSKRLTVRLACPHFCTKSAETVVESAGRLSVPATK